MGADPAALRALVFCAGAAVLKALALGWYGALVRGRHHAYVNPEDAATFGGTVVPAEHPEVQRCQRALRNEGENLAPFLAAIGLHVAAGGGAAATWALGGAFVALRALFSAAYLRAWQPWRTLSYVGATLALLGLLGSAARAALALPS